MSPFLASFLERITFFCHLGVVKILKLMGMCNNPQTVPITSEQLGRLIALLNSLISAIAAFLQIQVMQTD